MAEPPMTDTRPPSRTPNTMDPGSSSTLPQPLSPQPPQAQATPTRRDQPRMTLSVRIPSSAESHDASLTSPGSLDHEHAFATISCFPTPTAPSSGQFSAFSPPPPSLACLNPFLENPTEKHDDLVIPKFRARKRAPLQSHTNFVNTRIMSEFQPRDTEYTMAVPTRVASSSEIPSASANTDEEPSTPAITHEETRSFITRSLTGAEQSWRVVRELGNGSYSRVFLGIERSGFLAAVKVTSSVEGDALRREFQHGFLREVATLRELNHPAVITLHGFAQASDETVLALRFCPGGDLYRMTVAHFTDYSPLLVRRLFMELAQGVAYIHTQGYVHRDIKLENILLNATWEGLNAQSEAPLVTIADFGLSKRYLPLTDPPLTTRCGSDDYVAPEILMGAEYDGTLTDTWSMGVVLYALLENRLPFDPIANATTASARRARSRTAHRIARIEWDWVRLKATDGSSFDAGLEKVVDTGAGEQLADVYGKAKTVVENCLIRKDKRWRVADILASSWLTDAMSP